MQNKITSLLILSIAALAILSSFSCRPSIERLLSESREAAKKAPPLRVDTTVVHLPGLLLFKENPALYSATSFDIVCLDKAGLVTKVYKNIEKCECQLYQKDEDKIKRMRVLWMAYPIDQQVWQRTYFDQDSKPIKKDKLKITVPLQCAFIKEENTFGQGFLSTTITIYLKMIIIKGSTSSI